jgi:hypothetical protein
MIARRIRQMWRQDRLQSQPPSQRLTEAEARRNHAFVLDDADHGEGWDPADQLDRVRRGVKPMATLIMREGRRVHIPELALRRAAKKLGLGLQVVRVHSQAVVGVVFQTGGVTLSDFYDPDATLALYSRAGVAQPSRALSFHVPLETFARRLALEEFDERVKYQLMGLCFGYPVAETLAYIRGLRGGLVH